MRIGIDIDDTLTDIKYRTIIKNSIDEKEIEKYLEEVYRIGGQDNAKV